MGRALASHSEICLLICPYMVNIIIASHLSVNLNGNNNYVGLLKLCLACATEILLCLVAS